MAPRLPPFAPPPDGSEGMRSDLDPGLLRAGLQLPLPLPQLLLAIQEVERLLLDDLHPCLDVLSGLGDILAAGRRAFRLGEPVLELARFAPDAAPLSSKLLPLAARCAGLRL